MKLPDLQVLLERLKGEAERLRHRLEGTTDARALTQLLRPNLGQTPAPLRRLLEPVVAVAALLALVSLIGMGAFGFATLSIAAGLIYAILTQVFGLEFGLAT